MPTSMPSTVVTVNDFGSSGFNATSIKIYSFQNADTVPQELIVKLDNGRLSFLKNQDFVEATTFPKSRYQIFDVDLRKFVDIFTFSSLDIEPTNLPWLLIRKDSLAEWECQDISAYANDLIKDTGRPALPLVVFTKPPTSAQDTPIFKVQLQQDSSFSRPLSPSPVPIPQPPARFQLRELSPTPEPSELLAELLESSPTPQPSHIVHTDHTKNTSTARTRVRKRKRSNVIDLTIEDSDSDDLWGAVVVPIKKRHYIDLT